MDCGPKPLMSDDMYAQDFPFDDDAAAMEWIKAALLKLIPVLMLLNFSDVELTYLFKGAMLVSETIMIMHCLIEQ